jgi:hypothetical protein
MRMARPVDAVRSGDGHEASVLAIPGLRLAIEECADGIRRCGAVSQGNMEHFGHFQIVVEADRSAPASMINDLRGGIAAIVLQIAAR